MSTVRANLLLLLAAFLWGIGNIAHKTILIHLDPIAVVGLTCLIGGIIISPLIRSELRTHVAAGWSTSLLRITSLFAASMVLQQIAYVDGSVTNASFLISTYTIMTPAAAWLMQNERPGSFVLIAAILTLAGSFLMSGGLAGAITSADAIALVTAASFSIWTVDLGRHMRIHGRPFSTAAVQFLATAVLILPFSAGRGDLALIQIAAAWPELIMLGVFSTGVAFAIQTCAQRHTSASSVAVITSAEAVFAAIAAAAYLSERIDVPGVWGAGLILAAVILIGATEGRMPKTVIGPREIHQRSLIA